MAKRPTNHQHVVPRGDVWAVRGAGNKRDTARFPTQAEAAERAREIAINTGGEVVIHARDGRIRRKHSHGNDPFPPKG